MARQGLGLWIDRRQRWRGQYGHGAEEDGGRARRHVEALRQTVVDWTERGRVAKIEGKKLHKMHRKRKEGKRKEATNGISKTILFTVTFNQETNETW